MVSRILISIALLCSSVAMSQDENGLTFSQVLLVELTEEGVVVPEGKVWKVVSQQGELYHGGNTTSSHVNFFMNSNKVDIVSWMTEVQIFPIWAPSGTLFQLGDRVRTLSIIEFNTD